MIIKGRGHDNAGNLARYLLKTKEHETEFMMDLRDSASDDLSKSLTDWEAIGRCKTKGSQILYHSHIRLRDGERLKEAQWLKVIEDLETKLGFTNCPRAVIGHNNEKTGLHIHIVWSRLDPVKQKLVQLGNDRQQHHAVARAAEKEFGLEPVIDGSKKEPQKRRLADREIRALKDRGINKEKLSKFVRAAWDGCETGEEMRAMLGALSVEIKPGDRRDWVCEYKGLKMNPVRLLDDVDTAQFRDRMKDVDREAEKEKEKAKSRDGAELLRGRRADHLIRTQVKLDFANDAPQQAKRGFTKKRHKAPQPRLRKKSWYGDPGI